MNLLSSGNPRRRAQGGQRRTEVLLRHDDRETQSALNIASLARGRLLGTAITRRTSIISPCITLGKALQKESSAPGISLNKWCEGVMSRAQGTVVH